MPFVEIIYETGNKSVAFYDTDEEMKSALSEHHKRAINGEPATGESKLRNDLDPGESRIGNWVAERVKRVLIYDEHPAEFNQDQLVDSKELKKMVDDVIGATEMNGVVHVHTVAAQIRDMSNPLMETEHPHDSQYKMKESDELDMDFLKAVES